MILYDLYIFISRALMGANLKRWGKVQKSGGKLRQRAYNNSFRGLNLEGVNLIGWKMGSIHCMYDLT